MNENQLGEQILGSAIEVHKELGPGLLEATYEACLALELSGKGLHVTRQQFMPVRYKGIDIDGGYKIDLLVAEKVVVEVKSVAAIKDVHKAQLLSYLRLGGFKLGYLINFNETLLKNGIHRIANGL